MDKLSIGKMAKLNQVSIQTLRYYDKIGLLKPMIVDDGSKYRYYHMNQCAKLDMIQYMKCLGMSLDTIKEQFGRRDLDGFIDILENQEKWIDESIDDLIRMKDAVKRYKNNINRYINAPKLGEIQLEHIKARRIFSYDTGMNFYDSDLDTWEYMIRSLKEQLVLKNLPLTEFCNVGSILRSNHLEEREFYSTEVFIFVDEEKIVTEELPEGDYLTVYFDDFYSEIDYGNRLLDYAKDKGYSINGDYICEVVLELPFFEEENNMFIKVQIPVIRP